MVPPPPPNEEPDQSTPQAGADPSSRIKAAHELLTELMTTAATQPLAYQHGLESRVLASLYELFGKARAVIKDHPGELAFAEKATEMLNCVLRPLTSRWHKRSAQGLLESRDGGDKFRADLGALQGMMRNYARAFHEMAYDTPWKDISEPPAIDTPTLEQIFKTMPFGIPPSALIKEPAVLVSKPAPETAPEPATEPATPKASTKASTKARKRPPAAECSGTKELNASEANEVAQRRSLHGIKHPDGHDAVGLSFSGGGIRSATFCLGVNQVLADKGLLPGVDFLSTVSGGGYTGAFLTQQIGDPTRDSDWTQVAYPHGPDPLPIRRLRQRAKYLTARSPWDAWGMVTATFAGMFMNWAVPLLLLIGLAAITVGLRNHCNPLWIAVVPHLLWGVGLGIVAAVLLSLRYFRLLRTASVKAKRTGQAMAFAVAAWIALLAGMELHTFFLWVMHCGDSEMWSTPAALWQAWDDGPLLPHPGLISLGSLATLVPLFQRFLPVLKNRTASLVLTQVALLIAAVFIPLLGVATFLLLCAVGMIQTVFTIPAGMPVVGGHDVSGLECLISLFLILTLIVNWVLNINLTGPHRLYRNGLSKAFVEDDENRDTDYPLSAVNPASRAPYHLINAAINLPSSQSHVLRERKSDFFLFSKHWTGSPVTNYYRTSTWRMNGKPADLATAMAISGAAVSTYMGLSSISPLSSLLAFLNLRLGFWIRQPGLGGIKGFLKGKHPGFTCLLREMTGLGMDEHDAWLNLSDGGHIENLGAYELLRRRCKFIIAVDGEADPASTFPALMTLVRHAQIDFGIRIDADLSDLRPDPATRLSRSHYQLCRVHYPEAGAGHPAGTGLLLYLKLSVTGNESELIRRYRTNNPDFPHQTTLDQFFDEEQFEAYRQLGVHIAEGLFSPCLMNGDQEPDSICNWFRQLAANLLTDDLPLHYPA